MRQMLKGKVAIINGGATGMGRSTAILFAEEGANCVIADIKEKEGRQTAADATAKGKECIFIKTDMLDVRQIKACVDQTVKKFGTVDILIGCAGGSVPRKPQAPGEPPRRGGIQYLDEDFFDRMTALNYKGHMFFIKEVAPYMMQQRWGRIVLISSLGVIQPPGPATEYHGAKGAILGAVRNIAFELAPSNVTVNAILPGAINTPFWNPVLGGVSSEERDKMMKKMGENMPLGRIGEPEDIAKGCLFFASELADYITGESLNITGGLPMNRYDPSRPMGRPRQQG